MIYVEVLILRWAKKWLGDKPNRAKMEAIRENGKQLVVIFIHGLFGDRCSTWLNRNSGKCLYHYLAAEETLANYDLYTFGYKSNFHYRRYDFATVAELLHFEIKARFANKQIILITHSQGGIIAQQYLIDRLDNGEVEAVGRIKSVIFLAAPATGSILGNLFAFFHKQIRSLARINNRKLFGLGSKWTEYCIDGKRNAECKRRLDGIKRLVISGAQDWVVHNSPVNPLYIGAEHYKTDEDHFSIAKVDAASPVYLRIVHLLKAIAAEKEVSPFTVWIKGWDKSERNEQADVVLDWTDYFDINSVPRVLPDANTWRRKICADIGLVSEQWSQKRLRYSNRMKIGGKFCLSAGMLLGNKMSAAKEVTLEVEHYEALWHTGEADGEFSTKCGKYYGGNRLSRRAIVIINASSDITSDVKAYLTATHSEYKCIVTIAPAAEIGQQSIKTNGQAVKFAIDFKDMTDKLRSEEDIGEIWLFMSAPLSLAIFVGHYLKASCPVQSFEYRKATAPADNYVPACLV